MNRYEIQTIKQRFLDERSKMLKNVLYKSGAEYVSKIFQIWKTPTGTSINIFLQNQIASKLNLLLIDL